MKRSKQGFFVSSPKKTPIWRRHYSIGQSCCSMTSKRRIHWFLESSLGMKLLSPERSLNQPVLFLLRSYENRSNIEYSETKHYKQAHTQTTELKNRLDFCNFSIRTLKARAIHPFTNETGHLFYLSVSNLLIICYTVFLFADKTATLSINKTLYFRFLLPNWYLKQTSIILRDRTIPYI